MTFEFRIAKSSSPSIKIIHFPAPRRSILIQGLNSSWWNQFCSEIDSEQRSSNWPLDERDGKIADIFSIMASVPWPHNRNERLNCPALLLVWVVDLWAHGIVFGGRYLKRVRWRIWFTAERGTQGALEFGLKSLRHLEIWKSQATDGNVDNRASWDEWMGVFGKKKLPDRKEGKTQSNCTSSTLRYRNDEITHIVDEDRSPENGENQKSSRQICSKIQFYIQSLILISQFLLICRFSNHAGCEVKWNLQYSNESLNDSHGNWLTIEIYIADIHLTNLFGRFPTQVDVIRYLFEISPKTNINMPTSWEYSSVMLYL
jgi:hypothetical protein